MKEEIIAFRERNKLIQRLDNLSYSQQMIVHEKHLGVMSVVCNDPVYWGELEKFIKEFEILQTQQNLTVTERARNIIDYYFPETLDKLSAI